MRFSVPSHSWIGVKPFHIVTLILAFALFGCSNGPDPADGTSNNGSPTTNNTSPGDNNTAENNGLPGDNNTPNDGLNACGGQHVLTLNGTAANPGDNCGPCEDGEVVCDGENTLRCEGAAALNGCGNCHTLDGEPGVACDEGSSWQCAEDGSVICSQVKFPDISFGAAENASQEELEELFNIGEDSITVRASFDSLPNDVVFSDHGFCWSTHAAPTLQNAQCHSFGPIGTNTTFEATITELFPGTTYHIRGFVVASIPTASVQNPVNYSKDISATTKAAQVRGLTAPVGDARSSEYAQISWDLVSGVESVKIYRDSAEVATIPGSETTFSDENATSGSVPLAPSNVSAVGSHDDIAIAWDETSGEDGALHRYQIQLVFQNRTSDLSEVVETNRKAAEVSHYELQIDGGAWQNVGLNLSFDDENAPTNIITAPEISVSEGAFEEYVLLSTDAAATRSSEPVTYRVRAVNALGNGDASDDVSSSRTSGHFGYQWQRSDGDSPSNFSALPGASGTTHQDSSAPEDGSVRYYRLAVSAQGATTAYSPALAGFRASEAEVHTLAVEEIAEHSALLHGTLSKLGVPGATSHGFCLNTVGQPEHDATSTCVELGEPSTTGSFEHLADTLLAGTQYFVRAFVSNDIHVVYGEEQSFWTIPLAPVLSTTVRATFITLSWQAVEGAEKYVITRDNDVLAELEGSSISYNDTSPNTPNAPGMAPITDITKGTRTDGVLVQWNAASVSPATTHDYKVVAVNAAGVSSQPASSTAGLRAGAVTAYEIKLDDGPWQTVDTSNGLEYLDTSAPSATITAGDIWASQGTNKHHVVLSAQVDSVSTPATRTYRVRARNRTGAGI